MSFTSLNRLATNRRIPAGKTFSALPSPQPLS